MTNRDDLPTEPWTVIRVDWGYAYGTDYPYRAEFVLDEWGSWNSIWEDTELGFYEADFTFEVLARPVQSE